MSYKVDGIYTENNGYWESNEFFVKQGELRIIDNKLHRLSWSSLWTRFWCPYENTPYEARCVLKKVRKSK